MMRTRFDRPTRFHFAFACLVMALGIALPITAQGHGDADPAKMEKPAADAAEAKSNATQHSVTIDGQKIDYTATAGWLILKNQEGKPTARFGYTAYTKDGVSDLSRRPVMFAFNGGPGSSSIWLHMGVLGPRRVVTTDAGHSPPPPSEREANPYSIVDVSDLVMIDPVGTGFSKPVGEGKGSDFWGVDQDISSVAQFIKQYVTEYGRWASPKYVLGESYGGIRAAGLSWHLQSRHGMNLNGVILVSPFLDMGSGIDGGGIDLPHVLYFPTLAATAWYHDLLDDKPGGFGDYSLEDYMAEVERFAYEEYAPALLAGFTIDESRKAVVAAKLAGYTGTSTDYWLRADLRVSHGQFLQELQRKDRLITGRIDSRFTGPSVNPLAENMDYDPFFPAVGPAYTAAFLDYMHNELKFGQEETYNVSAFGIDWEWSHSPPSGGGWVVPWANLRDDLAAAMTYNPGLHVLVQQGYYDLATPLLATKHDIDHLDIAPEARERIRMEYYEAGHMMYLHMPSLAKYRDDLASFVRDTDRVE